MNPIRQRVIEEIPPALFADLTLSRIAVTLKELRFTEQDDAAVRRDISDHPPAGVYLTRVRDGEHQHVFLASYEGRFCEALVQVYAKPFDSRARVRQTPLYTNILRTEEAIVAAVTTVYPPLPRPGKT